MARFYYAAANTNNTASRRKHKNPYLHPEEEAPNALSRPIIIEAAPSILAFSRTKEEQVYTEIQTNMENKMLQELTMGEINMRRYLVSLKIGDQGDCVRIDQVVEATIKRDMAKRDVLMNHLKTTQQDPSRHPAEKYYAYYSDHPAHDHITHKHFSRKPVLEERAHHTRIMHAW